MKLNAIKISFFIIIVDPHDKQRFSIVLEQNKNNINISKWELFYLTGLVIRTLFNDHENWVILYYLSFEPSSLRLVDVG